MTTSMRNLAVGLFVLVALSLLGWMILKFGTQPRALTNTYRIRMNFPSVGSISEGAEVRVAGVVVGHVTDIRPDSCFLGGVLVLADIQEHYSIPRRCRAVIRPLALSLTKPSIEIEILPGPGSEMLPRDGTAVVPGELRSGFEGLIPKGDMASLRELSQSLSQLASAAGKLLEPRPVELVDGPAATGPAGETPPATQPARPIANITTVVQRLDMTLKNLNGLLEAHGGDISAIVVNLRDASADARAMTRTLRRFADKAEVVADGAGTVVKTANAQLKRVGDALVDNSTRLAAALDKLNRSLSRVIESRGTVGKLINDPTLYDSMLLAADRLHQAVIELQGLIREWEAEGVKIKMK